MRSDTAAPAVPGRSHRLCLRPLCVCRLFGFGWGAGNLLIVAFMESLEPAQGSGWPDAAWHAALLTLASLAPSLLSLWLMRPMRIGCGARAGAWLRCCVCLHPLGLAEVPFSTLTGA